MSSQTRPETRATGDHCGPEPRRYTTSVVSISIRKRALDRFAAHAREVLGPKLLELRLFGSEARGEAGPDSDLDVLVVVQPDTERVALEDRIIDIAFDVNLEFGLYISPRVVTRGILDDPIWRETPFLKNVVRESIPL
jgi:predicted nucleotidyltransferase